MLWGDLDDMEGAKLARGQLKLTLILGNPPVFDSDFVSFIDLVNLVIPQRNLDLARFVLPGDIADLPLALCRSKFAGLALGDNLQFDKHIPHAGSQLADFH